MASTALVTFFFESPVAARTVELLGSWDNFAKPYPMTKDRKRGHLIWSGCYSFQDVICDGDFGNIGQKRDGALKMGGTYWYYFRVNDDEEFHDPAKPSTTLCPLLPGQRLNVLEVPTQSRSRSSSSSSVSSVWFTLNPEDRFTNPKPPRPLTPRRKSSINSLERTQLRSNPMLITSAGKVVPFPRSARCATRPKVLDINERKTRSANAQRCFHIGPRSTPDSDMKDESFFLANEEARPFRVVTCERERNAEAPVDQLRLKVPFDIDQAHHRGSGDAAQPVVLGGPVQAKGLERFSPLRSHPVDAVGAFDFPADRPPKRARSLGAYSVPLEAQSRRRALSTAAGRTAASRNLFTDPLARMLLESIKSETGRLCRRIHSRGIAMNATSRSGSRPPSRRKPDVDNVIFHPSWRGQLLPSFPVEPLSGEEYDGLNPEFNLKKGYDHGPTGPSSQFSFWSADSMSYTAPTSNENDTHSPTFSSFTSSSGVCSPAICNDRSFSNWHGLVHDHDGPDGTIGLGYQGLSSESTPVSPLRSGRPSFSSFRWEMRHQSNGCENRDEWFGASQGFKGYSLPDEQITSDVTLTKRSISLSGSCDTPMLPGPHINHHADASVAHLENLMSEFGYLGEAVV